MKPIHPFLVAALLSTACIATPVQESDDDDDGGTSTTSSGAGGQGGAVSVGANGSTGGSTSTDSASADSATATGSTSGASTSTTSTTSTGPGGNGGAGGGGGGIPGHDLQTCTGPASSVGDIYGDTPVPTLGYVWPDPAGNIRVVLYPTLATSAGDLTIGVYFFVAPNQMNYPPNGSVGCAVLEDNGQGWNVIDTTTLCEVHLSVLEMASAEGVCDGVIEGTFQGIFTGNQPIAGTFSLPNEVAWSQTSMGPSCQPPNGPCSQHSDCCSQSCSLFIGVCN